MDSPIVPYNLGIFLCDFESWKKFDVEFEWGFVNRGSVGNLKKWFEVLNVKELSKWGILVNDFLEFLCNFIFDDVEFFWSFIFSFLMWPKYVLGRVENVNNLLISFCSIFLFFEFDFLSKINFFYE